MNDNEQKKVILRNSLLWGAAMVAPALVMVGVDATTRETPNQNYIAFGTSAVMVFLFVVSNVLLSKAFSRSGFGE